MRWQRGIVARPLARGSPPTGIVPSAKLRRRKAVPRVRDRAREEHCRETLIPSRGFP